jgi:ketosteroid isomerase-like protein
MHARSIFRATVVLAVACAITLGQTKKPDQTTTAAAEQEIIKLENALMEASIKKDRATLERFYADEYLYIHSNGSVTNKTPEIAEDMAGGSKWTSFSYSQTKVRFFGDVGILTGVLTLQGASDAYKSGARGVTAIFVKRDGRWQSVGGQATLLPTK